MPVFIFTSKRILITGIASLSLGLLTSASAWASTPFAARPFELAQAKPAEKTMQPEDEDYSNTPFTEYGEFNEDSDEEADQKFFQYGRFFGVSVGLGLESVDGGRGLLWQGGFPMVEVKVHYWFDFNFALDLGFFSASHSFEGTSREGHVDVNMIHLGVDLKYYFDTKNLSAPISFANPYLLAGGGPFTKTSNFGNGGVADQDSAVAFNFGAGLEFAIKPRKAYFELEGKMYFVKFKDSGSTAYKDAPRGIPDLGGNFYTLTAAVLFTW